MDNENLSAPAAIKFNIRSDGTVDATLYNASLNEAFSTATAIGLHNQEVNERERARYDAMARRSSLPQAMPSTIGYGGYGVPGYTERDIVTPTQMAAVADAVAALDTE